MRLFLMLLALGLGATLGMPLASAVVQDSSLTMLPTLSPGEWTVEFRDKRANQKICVRTGEELIQLGHSQKGCSRFVIEDSANRTTVQYTCRGDGYGRTDIRRENAKLVQLETQGIAQGIPFQFAAEARRTGLDCAEVS